MRRWIPTVFVSSDGSRRNGIETHTGEFLFLKDEIDKYILEEKQLNDREVFYRRYSHSDGTLFSKEERIEFDRQEEFYKMLQAEGLNREAREAFYKKDHKTSLTKSKQYLDRWLEFNPNPPYLHNFFQPDYWYWFNRVTIELVRAKRLEEAKCYLEYYFSKGWDEFPYRQKTRQEMEKRLKRVIQKLSTKSDDGSVNSRNHT